MLDTGMSLSLLTLMEIVGPLLLGAVLAYGLIQYRKRSRAMKVHTDETTRKLYREGGRQERQEEAGRPD
jgi:hypothetical protein